LPTFTQPPAIRLCRVISQPELRDNAGEVNNGGDLIETLLRSIDRDIPFRAVRASKGKIKRAEPIAALYEQGRVHHVGSFDKLEEQMTSYVPSMITASPDRVDALVWGLTELSSRSSTLILA